MPKYNNAFKSPEHVQVIIIDENKAMVGTLRVKPSSILWKPKGERLFLAVTLEQFRTWITDSENGARRVKSQPAPPSGRIELTRQRRTALQWASAGITASMRSPKRNAGPQPLFAPEGAMFRRQGGV